MKPPVRVAFLTFWFITGSAGWAGLTGCGKVGNPRPPIVRIPSAIGDLSAAQKQYDVILTWTNPSKYIDGSTANDLARVWILQNGKRLDTTDVPAPGKPQSVKLDVRNAVGMTQTYALEVETQRGRKSAVSNEVSISIADVPGTVLNLTGVMDQGRIRLAWQLPAGNPPITDSYIVRREGGGVPPLELPVTETHLEDTAVEVGKTYSYIVTAVRGSNPPVPGQASAPIVLDAKDIHSPAIPTGLQTPVVSDTGAILSWDLNTESDLAGYRVYRSENPDSGFTRLDAMLYTVKSIRDANYRSGLYYAVSAEDMDGNESPRSQPVRAP